MGVRELLLGLVLVWFAAKVAGVHAGSKTKPGQLFRRLFSRTQEVHA